MINNKADEVMEEHFQSLLPRYQIGLETSMKGSDFMFDCVHLLYYKFHKINLNEVDHLLILLSGCKTKKNNNKSHQ